MGFLPILSGSNPLLIHKKGLIEPFFGWRREANAVIAKALLSHVRVAVAFLLRTLTGIQPRSNPGCSVAIGTTLDIPDPSLA